MASLADEAAFDEFVRSRTDSLMRAAYLLTRDHQLAEDLVQTALFKAAKAWSRIEGDPEPYVRRILYTENISRWRRRRVRESPGEPLDVEAPAAPDIELRLTLVRALGSLTVKQRAVLVLRFYEDLTEVETARMLGIGVGTVKSTSRRALGRLRTSAPDLGGLIGANHD